MMMMNKEGGRKLLEVMDMFMAQMGVTASWCILIFKPVRLYTSHMDSLLCASHTSIK